MTGEYEKRRIYKSSASDVDSLFQANPLSELWSVSPALFLQVVAVGLATYSTPLALYYVLSTVIGLQSSTSPSIHFDQVIALIAIIIFGVFVWIAKIKTECALNLKICQKIERKLIASKLQSNALSSMERLIARDFDVVLENLAPALGLVFIPIFLLGISAVSMLALGDVGSYLVLIWLIFLPVPYFIGLYSSRNFEKILLLVGERVELCSQWLRMGPLLRNFGQVTILHRIQASLMAELKFRNTDSALRGADSYLIGFGSILPVGF